MNIGHRIIFAVKKTNDGMHFTIGGPSNLLIQKISDRLKTHMTSPLSAKDTHTVAWSSGVPARNTKIGKLITLWMTLVDSINV